MGLSFQLLGLQRRVARPSLSYPKQFLFSVRPSLSRPVPTITLVPSLNADTDEVSQQSFDFSKLLNLREVDFGVGWVDGGLPPATLSTFRPATSPRLSTIRLAFPHTTISDGS